MLIAAINKNHKNTYDFFYLPVDFNVNLNYLIKDNYY